MAADPFTAREDGLVRQQRRMFLLFAVVRLVFAIHEFRAGVGGANTWSLALIRAATVLSAGLFWVVLPRLSIGGRRWLLMVSGVVAGVCASAAALALGDHRTPYFAWLVATPFLQLLILRGDVRAAVGCGVTAWIGAATVLVVSRATPAEAIQWLALVAISAAIAVYASVLQRRLVLEEAAGDHARIEALERLAASKVLLAEAEQLARLGQLAAGVAHEINNPLGFVTSNLSYLEEELVNPELDRAEAVLVLKESHAGLRRIGQIVAELTALAHPESSAVAAVPERRKEKRYSIGLRLVK